MPADRCPTCDREGCDGARLLAEHRRAMAGGDHDAANVTLTEWAALGCRPVDWRARALAAESDAAKWRRVGPMIERLREAAKVARHDYATDDDATVDHRVTGHELIDAAIELLAATKEPS